MTGLLVVVLVVAGVLVLGRRTGDRTATPTPSASSGSTGSGDPVRAGQAFLTGWVDPDGRVVRRDQGGDTVSEGQAYAMLVAAGLDDRDTFARVWSWTRSHLLRRDGTLSWRWDDGQVVDRSSAADADLDAARALVLAGHRFGDASLTAAGVALGRAVLDTETVSTRAGLVLVAGNWATTPDDDRYAYNPSYASPAAYAVLATASGDQRWEALLTGSRAATAAATVGGLPADWAVIGSDGAVTATAGPAGRGSDGVRYSYDAARLPIRYAEACEPADRRLAAALTDRLASPPTGTAALDRDGRPVTANRSPVAAVGRAAAEAAAGDRQAARDALDVADQVQATTPTYYGAAWVALGRLMLQTDDLGGCPPLR
ncbi:endoglucanase [Friedmanniella endophytica]|uniref:Endoglucanase n=1 Tax=Microlunatus kandeliicorticis TaxID=1759536 RepID=A0A7W3IR37_9ACTN|nr:glycosyl hydrolase family 8 [Microlunatus kandeliicorticis]MBA8793714.1 endoglucanase [Microlunatus kandeliicorticis]